jgi:hypothetical protein
MAMATDTHPRSGVSVRAVRADPALQTKSDRVRRENRARREAQHEAHPIAAEIAFHPFADLDDLIAPTSRLIALKPLAAAAKPRADGGSS